MNSTPGQQLSESEVLAAADAIISAFAATDTDAYFAGFAPEATFLFHTEPARLDSRDEYRQLWDGWVGGGWSVLSCDSTDRRVDTFAGGAVFTHTVDTTVSTPDGTDSYTERETIVFAAGAGGRPVAVHEHLSPVPTSPEA